MTKQGVRISTKRENFSSRFGFIMACLGSAVGMGNIWLFPYRVGQLGGAAFLIPYFICVALLGMSGIVGEITLGRSTKTGPLNAYRKAGEMRGLKHYGKIGIIPVLGSLATAIGYSVVMAWILKYFVSSVTGDLMTNNIGESFGELTQSFGAVPWHIIVIVLTFLMMAFGIVKGIERVNKFMMPAFFALFVILAIRVAFLPGAERGYSFLLNPNFNALLRPNTWIYALGQAFFSLSLAGTGTVVYGSYLSDKVDVINSAKYIAIFDTVAAMVATMVIIPTVFAFGMDVNAGPPLMFITMPSIFGMIPLGKIVAIIFFLAVAFAGFTSLVNLFETPVEALQTKFGLSRKAAVATVLSFGLAVGVFIEGGDIVSIWMDIISIYIVPFGAILAGVTIYWICGKGYAKKHAQVGREKKIGKLFEPMGRYVFCGVAIIVFILGVLYGGVG